MSSWRPHCSPPHLCRRSPAGGVGGSVHRLCLLPGSRSRTDDWQPRRRPRGVALPAQRGTRRALSARTERARPVTAGGGRPLRGYGRAGLLQPYGARRRDVRRPDPGCEVRRPVRWLAARREPGLGYRGARDGARRDGRLDGFAGPPAHDLRRAYRDVGFGIRLGVPHDDGIGATFTADFGVREK